MTTWVLVANRVGARVLRYKPQQLSLVQAFNHPEGRLRDQDIEADRPGRTFDSHGEGRHAIDRGTSPHEEAAHRFARELASALERGRLEHGVDRIVLVAEPRFLGLLREHMDHATKELVTAAVSKDLASVSEGELLEHLHEVFPPR